MMQVATKTSQAQPVYVITAADRARQAQIARAWQAFDDELEPPLIPMEGEDPELANVQENIVSSAVEDIISFLFGDELEIRIDEGAPEEAQELLDTVWGRKETKLPLLQKLAQNGMLSGQAFLRLVTRVDKSIRLVCLDPYNVFVRTLQADHETVLLYCIEFCEEQEINGKATKLYFREEISRFDPQHNDPDSADVAHDKDTKWEIQHWTRIGDEGAWQVAVDPSTGKPVEPIPWKYSYCPVQTCQNLIKANSFWGKPEATKGLIKLNKSINFLLSNIQKIIKIYGHPILVAYGTGTGTIDIEPGRITQLPDVDQKIEAVQIVSDLANALTFLDKLHGIMERMTSVPAIASGVTEKMPSGPISGIALKVMCMALLKKIDKKRCLYGDLIINVSKAILQLGGFAPEIDVTLHWQSPLPQNLLEDLQAAILKEQVGYSKDTTLRELGADPEHEAELKKQEAEEAMTAFSRGTGFPPVNQQSLPIEDDQEETE